MAVAMSVNYYTVNGMILAEDRGGVYSEFVPDTLGSCVAVKDASENITYTADYWPYGEVRTSTGSKSSPWGFVGLLGYLTDLAKRLYVRARHLRVDLGHWMAVDPLWPSESAYSYVRARPVEWPDPSGLIAPVLIACGLACGLCLGCVGGYCGDCGADLQCWADCIRNAPPWVKGLCGLGCAGCLVCIGLLIRDLIKPQPIPGEGPSPGPRPWPAEEGPPYSRPGPCAPDDFEGCVATCTFLRCGIPTLTPAWIDCNYSCLYTCSFAIYGRGPFGPI